MSFKMKLRSNSIQRFIFATNDTASSNLTGKINIILFIYEDRKKMKEGLFFIFIYIYLGLTYKSLL